ncbi:MAG: DUF4339 domain-containing protein [Myxococcales bacterium]|nr:DUF4339 domain-containing protein [Myxococcales bacterium]
MSEKPTTTPESNRKAHRSGQRSRHRQGQRRCRKERVLHTRVSENLVEDIRRIAEDLRVPASNLVRNVLEEVFDVVESVSDDVGDLFEELLDEAEGARERIVRARSHSRRRAKRRSDGTDDAAWTAATSELAEAERGADRPSERAEWHFVENGSSAGPLSRSEFLMAVREGRVCRDTLVWCAGMKDWKPADEVGGLVDLLGPPPVPGSKDADDASSE